MFQIQDSESDLSSARSEGDVAAAGFEDQDNEEGGVALIDTPARPKSNLNPTTDAWLPGKTTLQDLEATYQKFKEDTDAGGPIAHEPPCMMPPYQPMCPFPGMQQMGPGAMNTGSFNPHGHMPMNFGGPNMGHGFPGNVPAFTPDPNFVAQNAHMVTPFHHAFHGMPPNVPPFSGPFPPYGGGAMIQGPLGYIGPAPFGGLAGPINQGGPPQPPGHGDMNFGPMGPIVPAMQGGYNPPNLNIQGTHMPFGGAAIQGNAGEAGGQSAQGQFNPNMGFQPGPVRRRYHYDAPFVPHSPGDHIGPRFEASGPQPGNRGDDIFSDGFVNAPTRLPQSGNSSLPGPAVKKTQPAAPSLPSSTGFVDMGPAPRSQDVPEGYIEPSNCFSVSQCDPGTDILRVDRRPLRPSTGPANARTGNRSIRTPNAPPTPTPIRAVLTPQLDQGYSDPYDASPRGSHRRQQSPQKPVAGGNNGTVVTGTPSNGVGRSMVLYSSHQSPVPGMGMGVAGIIKMAGGLRPKKSMVFKPDHEPQRLFFKDAWYDLELPPLDAAPTDSETYKMRSRMLQELTGSISGYPPISKALDPRYFPFEALSDGSRRPEHGVVKVKNIPFNAKRREIVALFGRNSRLLNDVDEPVHIIMDRVSSKTNDAYVEFMTKDDASRALDRFTKLKQGDKPPRLGDRTVQMFASGQDELMKELFPLAKNVHWDGGEPLILRDHPVRRFDNFRGFVSEEEMLMLVKHVDSPYRSPFSRDCPQRPFECLISTLKKMPWYCPEGITLKQRHAMYDATLGLLLRLKEAVRDHKDPVNLNRPLLNRLTDAAMYCPGFTVVQKDDIAFAVKLNEPQARAFSLPRFAASWRHLYGVRPKSNIPLDLIEWYAAIIREETTRIREKLPPLVRNEIRAATEEHTDSYFGDLWVELWRPVGPAFEEETIANASDRELMCIERVIRRALCP